MKQKLFLLAIMVSTALTVSAQKRKIDLWGHVYDHVTHHAISGAKATLMLADSTIVDSVTCGYYTGGYYGTDANYCFSIPRKPQQYIIKVTHSDYDPCFVDYEVKKPGRNTFFNGRASITLNKMGLRQGYNTTTGAFTQMLDNVSRPSWNLNQEAHFNRPLDAKKRLTLDAHSRISYEENNDFDVVQYSEPNNLSPKTILKSAPRSTVHTIYNTENLRFTYRINSFDLSATGDFAYRHSTSDRANFTTLNIFEYNYGFALNCRLPWKLQLAADAKMYSRRGYYSSTMNTDDFVCNASLSRSFLKESLTARLEAFDIFHQLSSTEYTLNSLCRIESWRKSIPSYLMLHLSWRWSHMPKKKA